MHEGPNQGRKIAFLNTRLEKSKNSWFVVFFFGGGGECFEIYPDYRGFKTG